MLSYEDILAGYSGIGKGSRLESALRGPMSSMLPPDESNALAAWAQDGGRPMTASSRRHSTSAAAPWWRCCSPPS
jgi:hypothetical protein